MFWMGIDVGTGGTRALLVDGHGQVKAGFTAPHAPMKMERPLWAEQDPENWWEAAQAAIRGVMKQAKAKPTNIKGIGLTGQMHGLVLLDENDQVIRPSIIWCDQRSQHQVDWINRVCGADNVLAWTANPVVTGFTLPKLLWVRDHEPRNFQKIRKVMLPKDYLRFKLTGEFSSDVSDASGTGLFDVVLRRWSKPFIEKLHLDASIFPSVQESSEVSGIVSETAAESTGLVHGTPVVAGAGDQAASAVGNGIVKSGVASCTLGTSGVVFAQLERAVYDPRGRVHTFCHAVPGKWHVMGVTQGAGLSLDWFRKQFAPNAEFDDLMAEAAKSPVGSRGLYWLPYLMGERTPHLDASARGGWIGITASHARADMIRALVEGVSFSQKDCLEVIEEMGVEVHKVRVSGGGAKSPFWRRILSDVFQRQVTTLATQEGSAYGAALLSLVGTEVYHTVPEACEAAIKETETIGCNSHDAAIYDRHYQVYTQIYPALRPLFGLMAD
ncbi:MAG: xylulokinase [Bryobacterales bacterium]|nr:xylulokinase [Bryobacterales bacterium]